MTGIARAKRFAMVYLRLDLPGMGLMAGLASLTAGQMLARLAGRHTIIVARLTSFLKIGMRNGRR